MKYRKIVFILLLFSVSLASIFFIRTGNDYFWHISAGKYMIKNHTILTHDIFSWYLNGKVWMSHEWLYECIIYVFKILFGNYNIFFYCIINIFILFLILFILNKNNYTKNTIASIVWIAIGVFINIGLLTPRPHLISSWLIALTLYLLYDLRRNELSRKIYLLPIVSLIWVNVHGGSSNLSYLLIILFVITGLFNIRTKYIEINKITKKQLYKYLIVLLLVILSLNINPHGYKMLIYPYENIFNRLMQQNITEWKPTSLSSVYDYVYYAVILYIIITFIRGKKKIKIVDLLIFLGFTYMGIRSRRFWNYIYIGSSFFIFDYIPKRKDDNYTIEILLLCATIIFVIVINNFKLFNDKLIGLKMIPTTTIDKLKAEKPKRLFNMYDYGGYLIYNNIEVFIDGRADLYSNYNYKDYIDISNNKNNTKKLIKKYDFDYFLVNKQYGIYKYLKNNKDYEEVADDTITVIYKKKDT